MATDVSLVTDGRVARVKFETDNGVHVFSSETRQRLLTVLGEVSQLTNCSVVVFESQGRTFLAGADIQEFLGLDAETGERLAREGQRLMDRVEALAPVTIAAIHGPCAGGGTELALACDMRIAAESARIGLPEVSLGILPGWGGTVRSVRLFGGAVARRMILTGELLTGRVAEQLGIVDFCVTDDQFRDEIDKRIKLVDSRGPNACQSAKRLIAEFESVDMDGQLLKEARAFGRCFATNEPQEGAAAFLEKRPANWDSANGISSGGNASVDGT